MRSPLSVIGKLLADYLSQPLKDFETKVPVDRYLLPELLQPADILLVEGNTRVSTAIKYLTQSTWSHAALYIGDALGEGCNPETSPTLLEADLQEGVIAVPLAKYRELNTRICRAINLSPADRDSVVRFCVDRLGTAYDLKNLFDLARYLFPTPPVPSYLRRRMLALGSGDPTRALCSTLIAQAYQSIHYPLLPRIEVLSDAEKRRNAEQVKEILHIRHHTLFTPRDFDLSPYFEVIKPIETATFDYRALVWGHQEPEVEDPEICTANQS